MDRHMIQSPQQHSQQKIKQPNELGMPFGITNGDVEKKLKVIHNVGRAENTTQLGVCTHRRRADT